MQNKITEAIILAGGLGTRLRSEVSDKPKILASVNNRAFIEYILDQLIELGIKRVVLALGFKSEQVLEHFKDGYKNLELDFSIEKEPLGTGGALMQALSNIHGEYSLVLNGDSFCKFNLNNVDLEESFTMFAFEKEDCSRYGTMLIKDNYLISFQEKVNNANGFINSGIYILKTNIFDNDQKGRKLSLEQDLIPSFLENNKIKVEKISGENFIDIGTPEDYKKAQSMFNQL